jgi:2-polyprenyl-3-methyl-5-hydroxy-6-metoxy-1,4-benzoquinol methylase
MLKTQIYRCAMWGENCWRKSGFPTPEVGLERLFALAVPLRDPLYGTNAWRPPWPIERSRIDPQGELAEMSNTAHSESADVSKTEIAEFYNEFSGRLVRGFVTGNPRIEHALVFASSQLPPSAKSLLEVGCGVGETTNRLCATRSDLRAVGVDISPENIRTAERLFGQTGRAAFAVSDLTQPVAGGPFDIVTLLDVYEHIPSADRETFHANLRQSMSEQSRLIVTCPSFLHQNFLHEHQPEGLQIVDETIGVPELVKLASDLGGHLSHLHYESVWRTNDYLYATIDTVMAYQWKEKPRGIRRLSKKITRYLDKTPLGGPARRERYVKERLAA